ncbi:MAG TPA: hypothetical protein V6C58_08905 [Allocoleopsis sp.]
MPSPSLQKTAIDCPIWTKNGLANLGRLIYASRTYRGYSLDDVVKIIQSQVGEKLTPSKKTLGNIENGVGEPKYNTIAAITAAQIIFNKYEEPYNILDVLNIASEKITPEPPTMKTIEEMVKLTMKENSLTLNKIKEQISPHSQYLNFRKFRTIFHGIDIPSAQHELRILRLICDPSDIFSEKEWIRAVKREELIRYKNKSLQSAVSI